MRNLEKQRTNSEATEHDEHHRAQVQGSAIAGEQEDYRHQRTSDEDERERAVNLLVAKDSREGLVNFQEDETGRDQVEYDEHRGDGVEGSGGLLHARSESPRRAAPHSPA